MTASTRLLDAFRVGPDLRDGELVGARVTCADGREYVTPQFPKRIRDITESQRGVIVHLTNGQRRTLGEQELLEAAATSATIEPRVHQLIEAGELDEAALEAAFEDELTEYFVTHRGTLPHPPRTGTVGFVNYTKHPDGTESHKAHWFHEHVGTFGSQDEAAKALRAYHKANKHRLDKRGDLKEAGPRGGASEAEMRARAMAYPPHQGGIGSSKREDIGHGIGRKYPPGFQHIRNALIRNGHSVGSASAIAYGALRRWSRGGGHVKPETRAKAGKVLGELEVGGKASRVKTAAKKAVTREATTGALREAIRLRKGLEPALSAYLAERGDRRPVSEDPESLREAAQRAISGHGPLKARSAVDQRVLDAQTRAVVNSVVKNDILTEATRTVTTVTQLEHGLREDAPAAEDPGDGVFVALPPEKGTMPTVVTEADTRRIGEVTIPRALDQTDLAELQEQAIALYNRTAAPTHQGRSYLSSAGRVELTQLVSALREALDTPAKPLADEVTPPPNEPLGGDEPVVPMRLPNGEAPPADTPHTEEEVIYADAALKRSGYSRDGRSAQGDYVLTADLYPAGTEVQKPLMEGEQLREAKLRGVEGAWHVHSEIENYSTGRISRHRSIGFATPGGAHRHAKKLNARPGVRGTDAGKHFITDIKFHPGSKVGQRPTDKIFAEAELREAKLQEGQFHPQVSSRKIGPGEFEHSHRGRVIGTSTMRGGGVRKPVRALGARGESFHSTHRQAATALYRVNAFGPHLHESQRECMIHVTTPAGKNYSREMGTPARGQQAASMLRRKGHKVRVDGFRESGPAEDAFRAAAAQALIEARKSGKRCKVCGQQLPVGASRCPGCGTTLGTELDSDDAKVASKLRKTGVLPPEDLPDGHPLKVQEAARGAKKVLDGHSRGHTELGRHGIRIHKATSLTGGSTIYRVRAPGQDLGIVVRKGATGRKAKGDGPFHAIARLQSGGFSTKATAHASVPEAAMHLARHHGLNTLNEAGRVRSRYGPEPGLGRSGFHNLGPSGAPRSVKKMSDGKLKYLHGHTKTHPVLKGRIAEEMRMRSSARRRGRRLSEGHRGKLYPSDIHGYDNLRGGKPRPVDVMTDDKLAHFAKHPDTHPELRKRVRAEIRRRKAGGERKVFRRAAPVRARKPRAKKIAEANWMSGAVKKPGQLHRDLGVPEDQNIPTAMITAAASNHKDPATRARARLALTFAKHRKVKAAHAVEGDASPLADDREAQLREAWSAKARAAALISRREHLRAHGAYTADHIDAMNSWDEAVEHARAAHHEGDIKTVGLIARSAKNWGAPDEHVAALEQLKADMPAARTPTRRPGGMKPRATPGGAALRASPLKKPLAKTKLTPAGRSRRVSTTTAGAPSSTYRGRREPAQAPAGPALDPRFRHHSKLSDVRTHADRPAPKSMEDRDIVREYDGLRNRGWTSADYRKSAAQHKRDQAQTEHNETRRSLLKKEMVKRGLESEEEKPLPGPDDKASLQAAGVEPTAANLRAFSRHKAQSRGYGSDLRGLNEMSRSAVQAHWQRINDGHAHEFAREHHAEGLRRAGIDPNTVFDAPGAVVASARRIKPNGKVHVSTEDHPITGHGREIEMSVAEVKRRQAAERKRRGSK